MSVAWVDNEQRVQLATLDAAAEICQPDGHVVGRYLPEAEYQRMLYRIAAANCPTTPEERERRRNETGGSSLAEFWQRMGAST